MGGLGRLGGALLALLDPPSDGPGNSADQQKGDLRQPGNDRQSENHPGRQHERHSVTEELPDEVGAKTFLRAGPRDNQSAGNRNHQSRDHGDQAVADGEHGIGLQRLYQRHPVLEDADQKSAGDVDAGDQNTGDRVALGEARRAIHGAIEIGLRR